MQGRESEPAPAALAGNAITRLYGKSAGQNFQSKLMMLDRRLIQRNTTFTGHGASEKGFVRIRHVVTEYDPNKSFGRKRK